MKKSGKLLALLLTLIMILSLFADTVVEKNVKLKIVFLKKEYTVDALVDSGNLLKDPMDLSPVMLVKSNFTKEIFPRGV